MFAGLANGDGVYAITPTDRFAWGGYYEPGSLIWRNRWITDHTAVECRDALAFPGDEHRTVILRRVLAVEKDVRLRVCLDVRAGYGARPMHDLRRDQNGSWLARTGDLRVRWSGAAEAKPDENSALGWELFVPAGRHHDFVLEISDRPLPDLLDAELAWTRTEHAWPEAVPAFAGSVAPRDARHAYAVLRGLTTRGGGMVAAATLGLPERAEAGRNYDYRYVWLRDQCYAAQAVAVGDPHPLFDDAVRFVTARVLEHGPDLAPAYRATGAAVPAPETLGLPAYPGGAAVTGNRATAQFQLDTPGEALQVFATAAAHDHLDAEGHRAAELAVRMIGDRWHEPDSGIWELDDKRWTHSRLACVAGLRAYAAQLPGPRAAELTALADAILAETAPRCTGPGGAWRRSPGDDRVDASLLLPPVRGAVAATDPRTLTTLQAVEDELTEDGYVYRFAQDGRPLGEAEGAFLLCGFTMSLAQWQQGKATEAFRWFERNRAACGPPGLFAEEYDVLQRQLRGNLPQAFVHASLLETAQRLATPCPR
ncbi:glycoside hydrolase family 15 protein [Amycolatopsis alkalitolerans]|uniref:Glycoside hydrolase family 15 protein n=1 Tax=Amycolatopsis alkalitolerans TaxID=2547244 RepID=A0A5C4M016_9PSEU|nr:glycoside hydrolase family 15 protein [Amycolatopsis alkalitolerans]